MDTSGAMSILVDSIFPMGSDLSMHSTLISMKHIHETLDFTGFSKSVFPIKWTFYQETK